MKSWPQVVEEIGFWVDQCVERQNGQIICEWCPAHEFCISEPDICTCADVLREWAKKETDYD